MENVVSDWSAGEGDAEWLLSVDECLPGLQWFSAGRTCYSSAPAERRRSLPATGINHAPHALASVLTSICCEGRGHEIAWKLEHQRRFLTTSPANFHGSLVRFYFGFIFILVSLLTAGHFYVSGFIDWLIDWLTHSYVDRACRSSGAHTA